MPRRTRSRMERRQAEAVNTPLLDLTAPPDTTPLVRPQPRRPRQPISLFPSTAEIEKAKCDRQRDAAERQRQAAMRNGIDWSVCIVPGCGEEPPGYHKPPVAPADQHDPNITLPVCKQHGSIIWRTMNQVWKDPDIRAEMLAADSRYNEAVQQRERRVTETEGPGHIYFLRQNGLIKVGWSGQVGARLKSYGPNVEILCHYPGSRQDETTLHQQLRPSLAKGREWYHDDAALALFVENAVERHGPPTFTTWWSQPKKPTVAGRNHR